MCGEEGDAREDIGRELVSDLLVPVLSDLAEEAEQVVGEREDILGGVARREEVFHWSVQEPQGEEETSGRQTGRGCLLEGEVEHGQFD